MATTHNEGDVTFCSHSPLKDSPFHWTTTSYRQMVSDDQLQPQKIIHSDKQISFLNPPPPSSPSSFSAASPLHTQLHIPQENKEC